MSYTWHDQYSRTPDGPIIVNGTPILVSGTIIDVLRRLRYIEIERRLWVDALCIDQSSNLEKTHQVNMMDRIYKGCESCNIWLGELDEHSVGVSAIDTDRAFRVLEWTAEQDYEDEDTEKHVRTPVPAFIEGLNREEMRRAGKAIKAMMHLRWWGRMWTVQEALLPQQAMVYWGSRRLDGTGGSQITWAALSGAAWSMLRARTKDIHVLPSVDNGTGDFTGWVNGLRFGKTEALIYSLHRWQERQSIDARDKVYGIMGLQDDFRDCLGEDRSCDYSVDPVSLYIAVTKYFILKEGNLRILLGMRARQLWGSRHDDPAAVKGLPSWVKDWTRGGPGMMTFFPLDTAYLQRGYCADLGLRGVVEDGSIRMQGQSILVLQAVRVGTVVAIGSDHPVAFGASDDELAKCRNTAVAAYQNWLKEEGNSTGFKQEWTEALQGIAVGNMIPGGNDHASSGLYGWYSDFLSGQFIFATDKGRWGVGTKCLEVGLEIWVVGGCAFPVVLEPVDGGGTNFRWVADCLVYGIMSGEAVKEAVGGAVDIFIQ